MAIHKKSSTWERATTRNLQPKIIGLSKKESNPSDFGLELHQPMLSKGIHDSCQVSLLHPYKHDMFDRNLDQLPPTKREDETLEYEVEKILYKKRKRNKLY